MQSKSHYICKMKDKKGPTVTSIFQVIEWYIVTVSQLQVCRWARVNSPTLESANILNAGQPRMEKPGPYCVIGGASSKIKLPLPIE
jgi:hypothetical protein